MLQHGKIFIPLGKENNANLYLDYCYSNVNMQMHREFTERTQTNEN